MIVGQANLRDAVRRTIEFTDTSSGKEYRLNDETATLVVRPRGWHLDEKNLWLDGEPISGAILDFALYLFHNHDALRANGTGPYYYLPKLESHLEARLWNQVFIAAQDILGIARGTIKVTVLIETIMAAFEMDEILFELREHITGLNCGRWDYIFSFIKRFRNDPNFILPDRGLVTMQADFLRNYSLLLIQTCHRRGAHAMGGMAAQIPIKSDPEQNEIALAKVRADKQREAADGHDGTWVAHPGLVAIAKKEFAGRGPNQVHQLRPDVMVSAADLLQVPKGPRTEQGLRTNVRVSIYYLAAWLQGNGCVPIDHLMEDAATAEISRTQLWQWRHHGATLDDGRVIDEALVRKIMNEEMKVICEEIGEKRYLSGRFEEAHDLFLELVLAPELTEFLTLPAYDLVLDAERGKPAKSPNRAQSNGHVNGNPGNRFHRDVRTLCPDDTAWMKRRWAGVKRDYSPEDVVRLQGSVKIKHTLAEMGAVRLWNLLEGEDYVAALGAMSGNQAMQMVRAGLKAIYLSGWQVAADANVAGQMYPDQSLYPANSAPMLARRINAALQRADQIDHLEGRNGTHWFAPIVADAEAGFGGPLNAFELMKGMIEAGAAAVHFEDQLASEKKCGHMGGKVLVPTQTFIRTLNAARLAADVMDVPTILVARTDANAASLLTTDVDPRDHRFLTGARTPEGFHYVKPGLDQAIARALAYAPYADMLWCETAQPNLAEARRFAEAIKAEFPDKLLAYNCSPSFNWAERLDTATIARFQRELGAMGYKFQFVTLAGFHALNHKMFELALDYKSRGMAAYSELQEAEFRSEAHGYSATRHQREVGTGYFDAVTTAVGGGQASTTALSGSTEEEQFQTAEQRAAEQRAPAKRTA
jgi:malate synthase A